MEAGEEEDDDREGLEPEGLMSLMVVRGTMWGTEIGRCLRGEGVVPPVFLMPGGTSLFGPAVVASTVWLLGSRATMVIVLGGDVGVGVVASTLVVEEEAEEEGGGGGRGAAAEEEGEEVVVVEVEVAVGAATLDDAPAAATAASVLGGARGVVAEEESPPPPPPSSSAAAAASVTSILWTVAGVEGGLGAGLAFLGGTGGGGMASSLRQALGDAPGDISGLRDPKSFSARPTEGDVGGGRGGGGGGGGRGGRGGEGRPPGGPSARPSRPTFGFSGTLGLAPLVWWWWSGDVFFFGVGAVLSAATEEEEEEGGSSGGGGVP